MLIFSPYSRRKDEQLQSILKFSGLRNNLKEIITNFSKSVQKSPRELTKKVMFSIISEAKYEGRAKAQKGTKNDKASCM